MKEWDWFELDEFRCKCGCGRNEIQEELVDNLDKLRGIMGIPFRITSGFRCPAHNEKVSSTGRNGPHTTGLAADILLSGRAALEVVRLAGNMGFTGIGLNQKGPYGGRFVHLDLLNNALGQPRPHIWTY